MLAAVAISLAVAAPSDHSPVQTLDQAGVLAWYDERRFAALGPRDRLLLGSLGEQARPASLHCDKANKLSARISANRVVFICEDDATIRLVSLWPEEEVGQWSLDRLTHQPLLSPDGSRVVVDGGAELRVLESGNPAGERYKIIWDRGARGLLTWSEEGSILTRSRWNGKRAQHLNVDTGEFVAEAPVSDVSGLSPDGAYRVQTKGQFLILEDAGGRVLAREKLRANTAQVLGQVGTVMSALDGSVGTPATGPLFFQPAWTPDSQYLIVPTNQGQVRQYRVPELTLAATYSPTNVMAFVAVISPDGTHFSVPAVPGPIPIFEVSR